MSNFPNIQKLPHEQIRSSDYEEIRRVQREFNAMWQASKSEFDMLFMAWRFFFNWPQEMWDEAAIREKSERGERCAQYSMVAPKLSILHGAIMADEYDFKYKPVNRKRTSVIEAIESAYYDDKSVCDFPKHYSRVVLDGLIHHGVIEPYIRKDIDPRGNIGFRRAIPGRWVFDPYWKTDDDNECMKGAKHGSMTVKMLKDTYRNLPDSPLLSEFESKMKRKGQSSWTPPKIDELNTQNPIFDHAFHVIEYHEVEHIRKERIVAYDIFGQVVVFPVTTNEQVLEEYAMRNQVDNWREARIMPYDDYVDHQTTICPELFPTKIIEKGKPEIQIKGIPAIQFTAERDIAGRNKGVVMDLLDPQRDINYSKSKIQSYMANALGGGMLYSKTMMPDTSKQEDFEKNHNDPTRAWAINGDVRAFAQKLRDANVNPELIRQVNESIDLMDRLSNVTSAMHAQTESANEPASLYAMRLRQSRTGMRSMDDRVKYLRKRMAEAYYYQAQITYSDIERTFSHRDGKRDVTLNERVEIDGSPMMRNKVDALPRVSVQITEAPNNLTKQLRDRSEIAAVIESTPETYREVIAIAVEELFDTTNVSDDTKGKLKEAMILERIKAKIQTIAEISAAQANAAQSDAVSQQALAQIQQLAGEVGQQQTQEAVPEDLSPVAENPAPKPQIEAGAQPIEEGSIDAYGTGA